ncbi:hypothetical protein [Pyrococcus kukulkanii]|uniref:hypothetical protein n=1 Tax=Pyrococcus kukulkanii TaxID=1609559 RepID=UPI00356704EC
MKRVNVRTTYGIRLISSGLELLIQGLGEKKKKKSKAPPGEVPKEVAIEYEKAKPLIITNRTITTY